MSEQFKEELRLICFAVVVESIENLYYKEIDSDNTNTDSVKKSDKYDWKYASA